MSEKQITEVTRRNISDALALNKVNWAGRFEEQQFLARLYDVSAMPSTDRRYSSASEDIWKHRVMNSDWADDWVFYDSRINLINAPDEEFIRFLCEMLHPAVQSKMEEVERILALINEHLAKDGWELREEMAISGRPVFAAVRVVEINVHTAEAGKVATQCIDARYVERHADQKPTSIFINYRRDDASAEARLIFDFLEKTHGLGEVFMDVTSIAPGGKWPHEIESNLRASTTVIAVIGPDWLLAGRDEWGNRRIDDASDWVRRELEVALEKRMNIIPVLVRGAKVPPQSALPASLRELFQRQGIEVRRDYWSHDIKMLKSALNPQLPPQSIHSPTIPAVLTANFLTPAEVKRERDLEQLMKVFHWVHLGVLDDYIERLGSRARTSNAGTMMFDRLREVMGSARFYLSDVELRDRLDAFMETWGNSQLYINEMILDKRCSEMIFWMPGDLFQSREQKKHVEYIMAQAAPMKITLDEFLAYVREHYLEIEPDTCGMEALKEYEIEEAELKEMIRLRDEL